MEEQGGETLESGVVWEKVSLCISMYFSLVSYFKNIFLLGIILVMQALSSVELLLLRQIGFGSV